jgi:hypothetical protein
LTDVVLAWGCCHVSRETKVHPNQRLSSLPGGRLETRRPGK